MTSTPPVCCGPCKFEGITKGGEKWCTICDEGFCADCEKNHRSLKLTRNHKMIAIEDFLKIKDFSVNLTCETHDEKLDLYCKCHHVAVCAMCIHSAHNNCPEDDIISIHDAAINAKSSTALSDLEETISRSLESVRQCIRDRASDAANIDTEKQTIQKKILETRQRLSKHLDELEQQLLQELQIKHENCRLRYSKMLKQLQQSENELEKLKEQTDQMKLLASDLQVFLGTSKMNITISEKLRSLKVEIGKEKSFTIDLKIHPVVISFINNVKKFGEIYITEKNLDLQLKDAKIDQAQTQIRGSNQNVLDIDLQFSLKFPVKPQLQISGCLILCDGRILIADFYTTGKLMEYDFTGNYVSDIDVEGRPFDLTEIDNDRFAVTYPDIKCLKIISSKISFVEKKIDFKNSCFGISCHDENIFTLVQKHGIMKIDITGTILLIIKFNTSSMVYIAASEDKIYYTDENNDTVNCCDFKGKKIWTFKNESTRCPRGITVNNDQNVYVVSSNSNNLTLIQHDGKRSIEVLTSSDDLFSPVAVCCNKNSLLLGYKKGNMALYHVSE
ncbi:uncharacterized protein LOC134710555 [Mytilus trossulus]|uniref:uncharacterized protein LOC134710555 n=1 Tax=Mytilus trossulus TaxID=6551 RepID=UPI003006B51A